MRPIVARTNSRGSKESQSTSSPARRSKLSNQLLDVYLNGSSTHTRRKLSAQRLFNSRNKSFTLRSYAAYSDGSSFLWFVLMTMRTTSCEDLNLDADNGCTTRGRRLSRVKKITFGSKKSSTKMSLTVRLLIGELLDKPRSALAMRTIFLFTHFLLFHTAIQYYSSMWIYTSIYVYIRIYVYIP